MEAALLLLALYSPKLREWFEKALQQKTEDRKLFRGKVDYSYDFFYIGSCYDETKQAKMPMVQCIMPDNTSSWELILSLYCMVYPDLSKKELCHQLIENIGRTKSSAVPLNDLSQDTIENSIAYNLIDKHSYWAILQDPNGFAELYYEQYIKFNDEFVRVFSEGKEPDPEALEQLNQIKAELRTQIDALVHQIAHDMEALRDSNCL